jgi:hypothetical protein
MTSANNKTLNARLLARRQIWYRHPTKENTKVRPEMTKFKMFREKVNMDFYFVELHSKILVGDKNLLYSQGF